MHAQIQSGGGGGAGGPHPPEKSQNIGFLSNTGLDPLKNLKATKPAFNVGPSLARQGNAISMVFRWQADDGLLIVVHVSGSSLPSSTKIKTIKKTLSKVSKTTPFMFSTISLVIRSLTQNSSENCKQ